MIFKAQTTVTPLLGLRCTLAYDLVGDKSIVMSPRLRTMEFSRHSTHLLPDTRPPMHPERRWRPAGGRAFTRWCSARTPPRPNDRVYVFNFSKRLQVSRAEQWRRSTARRTISG